ncbi:hypothetical protein JK167_12350 [Levilactobacillus brevis]|uniref:Uncharacterized protein n=1 Tax=Levilactobacillus brevis TaxID=1580 RepID=A0AA41ERN1_LEVBR|nr:hypothetical protein [Levilactobacillus brevis]MBS0948465.1 hypothetical protein [Levilactobacillus brevis]MBS1011610.1 hypothetical protein [Levilactobacillus brevis]
MLSSTLWRRQAVSVLFRYRCQFNHMGLQGFHIMVYFVVLNASTTAGSATISRQELLSVAHIFGYTEGMVAGALANAKRRDLIRTVSSKHPAIYYLSNKWLDKSLTKSYERVNDSRYFRLATNARQFQW